MENTAITTKPKSKTGGRIEGAGRPKGAKNKKTLEHEAALAKLRDKIIKKLDPMFIAAYNAVVGERFIYKISREKGPRGGEKYAKHELLTSASDIQHALDVIAQTDGQDGENEDDYYYVNVKPADTRAFNDLLNRVFGRPKETLELDAKKGGGLDLAGLILEAERVLGKYEKR